MTLVTGSTVSSPCSSALPSVHGVSSNTTALELGNDTVSSSHYLRMTRDTTSQRKPLIVRPPDLRPAGRVSKGSGSAKHDAGGQ